MVQFFFNKSFYMAEIDHHTILVECLGATIYGDNAVVSMQILAFTFVCKMQLVGKGHFNAF